MITTDRMRRGNNVCVVGINSSFKLKWQREKQTRVLIHMHGFAFLIYKCAATGLSPVIPMSTYWTSATKTRLHFSFFFKELLKAERRKSEHSFPLSQYLPLQVFTIGLKNRVNNPWLSPHLFTSTEACLSKPKWKSLEMDSFFENYWLVVAALLNLWGQMPKSQLTFIVIIF